MMKLHKSLPQCLVQVVKSYCGDFISWNGKTVKFNINGDKLRHDEVEIYVMTTLIISDEFEMGQILNIVGHVLIMDF